MNKFAFTTVVVAAPLSSAAVLAQPKMDETKGTDMTQKPAAGAPMAMSHPATGVGKKVDAKAGLVTLAHEPVKTMNWPAMTMGFMRKDKLLFDKLVIGKKANFDFVHDSQGDVVTTVKQSVRRCRCARPTPGQLLIRAEFGVFSSKMKF